MPLINRLLKGLTIRRELRLDSTGKFTQEERRVKSTVSTTRRGM